MIRIVKMKFAPEKVHEFKELFGEKKEKIRSFPGCQHLELWQNKKEKNVFFTFSSWDHQDSLEKYRQSALFRETWNKTRSLFIEKAEAWSMEQVK